MKIKSILCSLLVCAVLTQGCQKSESVKSIAVKGSPKDIIAKSTGLSSLNAVGDYGTYQFLNAANGYSAEVANLSLDDGGTGDLTASYSGISHQKWRITYEGSGYFTIMNLGSGKFAQSYNYNGTQVLIQNSADTAANQLWAISTLDSGKSYKVVNKADGLAITGNGTGMIQLAAYSGTTAQNWGYNELPADSYRDDQVVGFFHRANPALHSVAFDQGNSIPLSDGHELWITEDAFNGFELAANGDIKCNYFINYRNSMLVQPANHSWDPNQTTNITINNSTSNQPLQVCNIQPGTQWTWPGQGIELNGKVYVIAGEGNGLSATGNAFYVFTENPSSYTWAVERDTVTQVNSNAAGVGYGGGFYKAADGYIYSFGSKGVFFNANDLFVARFQPSNFFSWTFWNGSTWASTPSAANAAVIGTSQQNVFITYWHGKYIMMQMDEGFFCDPTSHNIYLSTSSSPTGPFSAPIKVWTIEDMDGGHIIKYYTPAIHPEFDNGKNELLLTYSVNFSPCTVPSECVNGTEPSKYYQVKGVRVPASVIGLQ
jgi:hypothetical protein